MQVSLFNYFLIDIMQKRLLHDSSLTKRTALQYFELMLDIFTNSSLIMTMFYFFTGLPESKKEQRKVLDFDIGEEDSSEEDSEFLTDSEKSDGEDSPDKIAQKRAHEIRKARRNP